VGTGVTVDVAGGPAIEGANSILRVIVENMIYPITLDVLHQVRGNLGLMGGFLESVRDYLKLVWIGVGGRCQVEFSSLINLIYVCYRYSLSMVLSYGLSLSIRMVRGGQREGCVLTVLLVCGCVFSSVSCPHTVPRPSGCSQWQGSKYRCIFSI